MLNYTKSNMKEIFIFDFFFALTLRSLALYFKTKILYENYKQVF